MDPGTDSPLRHPDDLAADLLHPVRHAFFAAIPISLLLLATLGVAHFGPAAPGVGCCSVRCSTCW